MRKAFVVVAGLFVLAGGLWLARQVIGLGDPAYQDPVTSLDFLAAWLAATTSIVTSIVLYLWWRITPAERGAWLVLVGAVGLLLAAVGSLIASVFDMRFGEEFGVAGVIGAVAVGLGGIVTLTVPDTYRWSGLFLVAFAIGVFLPESGGLLLAGGALIGMGYWLTITWTRQQGEAATEP